MLQLQADTFKRDYKKLVKYLKNRGVQTDFRAVPPKMVNKGVGVQKWSDEEMRNRDGLRRQRKMVNKGIGIQRWSDEENVGRHHDGHQAKHRMLNKTVGVQIDNDEENVVKTRDGQKMEHRMTRRTVGVQIGNDEENTVKQHDSHKTHHKLASKGTDVQKLRVAEIIVKNRDGHNTHNRMLTKAVGVQKCRDEETIVKARDDSHKTQRRMVNEAIDVQKWSDEDCTRKNRDARNIKSSVAFFIPAKVENDSDRSSELSIYRRKRGAKLKPRQPPIVEVYEEQEAPTSYSWSDVSDTTSTKGEKNDWTRQPSRNRRVDLNEVDVAEKYYSDDSRFVDELNQMNLTVKNYIK